jgi:hypothetical protein
MQSLSGKPWRSVNVSDTMAHLAVATNTMPDSFTSKVQRQIERLRHCSYQAIEAEVAQMRLAWFRQHEQITTHYDHPTPP